MRTKLAIRLSGLLMLAGPVVFAVGFFIRDVPVEVAGGFASVVGLQIVHQYLGSW